MQVGHILITTVSGPFVTAFASDDDVALERAAGTVRVSTLRAVFRCLLAIIRVSVGIFGILMDRVE